jgi:hypothetical protein
MALDFYNDFLSRHDVTHFCQMPVLKPLVPCPYQDPLSTEIHKAYGIGGSFIASLFATEGQLLSSRADRS